MESLATESPLSDSGSVFLVGLLAVYVFTRSTYGSHCTYIYVHYSAGKQFINQLFVLIKMFYCAMCILWSGASMSLFIDTNWH